MAPFRPAAATVTQATSTTTTAAVALTLPSPLPPTYQVRVVNKGSDAVHVRFGGSGVAAATTTANPVRGGETEIFTLTASETHFTVIADASTPTVCLTVGYGS